MFFLPINRKLLELPWIYRYYIVRPNLAQNYAPNSICPKPFNLSQILISPRHSMHWPDMFSNYPFLFYLAYLIYTPAMTLTFYFVASFVQIMFQAFSTLIILALPIIQELTLTKKPPGKVRKFKCSPELGAHREHLIHVYRSLQLAMHEIRLLFGKYLPPCQTLLGQLTISTGYICIAEGAKIDGATKMAFILTVSFAVLSWTALMICAGKIQKSSNECLTSWRVLGDHWESRADRKYMSKFRKSCKPIFLGLDGYMIISHKSVLKFLQGIVRGLFRTLLALKGNK